MSDLNPFASTANTTGEKIAGERDSLGGFLVDSDAYEATIKVAYAGKSDGGAASMSYEVEFANGRTFKWTEWTTSGDAKGNKPYWVDEKSGAKNYLPGFNRARAISKMVADKELHELKFEIRQVKLYNKVAQAEVPTPTPVAVELIGQKIYLGIQKQLVNKTADSGEKTAAGKPVYKRIAEGREVNEVDKIFHFPSKRTLQEAEAKVAEAAFFDDWVAENKGKVVKKMKKAEMETPAGGGTSGAPGEAKPETTSLF